MSEQHDHGDAGDGAPGAGSGGAAASASTERDRRFGAVTVLFGEENGKYPDGNTLLVEGSEERLLVDPSLTVHRRGGVPGGVDRIIISHAHEDHVAALVRFDDAPVHVHEADAVGVQEGVEGMLEIYGYDGAVRSSWRQQLLDEFHVVPRPDALTFADGHVFDLGGGTTATVVHLPGHTRGHCGLLVEPDGFFYVADVDLTGFGPYYGDAWSDLEGFEVTLDRCREVDARWYGTFHHKGVIEGRDAFLPQLEAFGDIIRRREDALVDFLRDGTKTLDDIVERRFVYRPHVVSVFVEAVERRSAELHLARLIPQGLVTETEPGRYRATA